MDALLLCQVEKFWETESFIIATPDRPLESDEGKLSREKLEATIQFDGTKCEVGLPWISDDIALPDKYSSALRRLFSIENKFAHNSYFSERCKDVIDDYVAKGFPLSLKESELKGTFWRNWYLSHHVVVNPRKPEKVRVVFDASAKYQGVALNEVLLKEFPEASEQVYKIFYVDNLLESFYNEDEASRAVKDSTALLKKRGFHLNQSLSSFRRVLPRIPEDDCNQPRLNLDIKDLPSERTLGVLYDSESDSFIFDVAKFCFGEICHRNCIHEPTGQESNLVKRDRKSDCPTGHSRRSGFEPTRHLSLRAGHSKMAAYTIDVKTDFEASTKRRILSAVSTLYDPLGFLSPVSGPSFRTFNIPQALTSSSDIEDIQRFLPRYSHSLSQLSSVLLISCLNTRAVHLEVAASLDLSSFFITFASFNFSTFFVLLSMAAEK
ncbi:Uncharacterized protein APZ42_013856 [Daphnia magna]|uniref:Uncharacterized protein n=1 Tax=Daphnia magna TaxID=35525 RepID=A0A162QHC9_9CRUS|nr:Uncharacterized protein APZ42_013856 [Daphnia magna]